MAVTAPRILCDHARMSESSGLSDALLERLRQRIADPARRLDQRPSAFLAEIATMDLGQMFDQIRTLGADLNRVVEANQAGRIDPEMTIKASRLGASMMTPAETPRADPATPESLALAEERLGFGLPPALRQLHGVLADGGFGPGSGILPIKGVVDRYLAVQGEAPRNQTWPDRLLPLVDDNPVLECLDASRAAGAVISWDPEDLWERVSDTTWQRSFSQAAPSLEAWLSGWLDAGPPDEAMQPMMPEAMAESVRQTRAYFAAMSPAERAEYGLPEVGWEREIGGGLGLEEDD